MSEKHIPQKYLDLCAEVAALCRAADLTRAGFAFTPGHESQWHDQIQMSWSAGRHDEDVDRFTVSSTLLLTERIEKPRTPHTEDSPK